MGARACVQSSCLYYGGYWIHQDRDYFEPVTGLYHNVGIALARRGIGVATISYRLVPDVPFEDELDDVALATKWTHDHIAEHGGDPNRIVLVPATQPAAIWRRCSPSTRLA